VYSTTNIPELMVNRLKLVYTSRDTSALVVSVFAARCIYDVYGIASTSVFVLLANILLFILRMFANDNETRIF
jgi:hypothetical protein